MRLIIRISLCLSICVVLSCFCGTSEGRSPKNYMKEDADISAGPFISGLQQIPQRGDVVRCDDGSSYKITDVSRYLRESADLSVQELLPETFSSDSLEADAVHFADPSGDYLFIKNRYEIVRMLYTLNESAEDSGIGIPFSIPESAVPIVQESWDPDQVIESWNVGHTKICCLEAWARLASRAAFRSGQAVYSGHVNHVSTGEWAGGIVGLKSILGTSRRQKALDTLDRLAGLGYIDYALEAKTKKLAYHMKDWVQECSGAPCMAQEAVYATDGYGFLCQEYHSAPCRGALSI